MAATIKDIAKKTGLGLATISSYLNGGNVREKNRILIEEAIDELHYEVNEVARGLKTNRTKIIGIIIPELNNIFCAEIITEVEEILRKYDYATIICDCRTSVAREKESIEFLIKRRVDGVIIMPSGSSGKHLDKLKKAKIPFVILDRMIEDVVCDYVLVDNKNGARDAVKQLIAAGHQEIGVISGPENIYTAKERVKGYLEALEECDIPVKKTLIYHGDYTIKSGVTALKMLLENNPDITAVFVANYELTMGVIIAANELDLKIPEQLSVVGFDNVEFARACIPKLSIVSQPTAEIAKNVSELLLQRLEANAEDEEYIVMKLNTGFVEGKSVRRR